MDDNHLFIQGQCNSNQCLLLRRGRKEFCQGIVKRGRCLPAIQWSHKPPYIPLGTYSHSVFVCGMPSYCTALQTRPLSILKGCGLSALVSVTSVTAEKKPISSSDTAWQYCLNGCRHMPNSSGQPAVYFTVHVTILLSQGFTLLRLLMVVQIFALLVVMYNLPK